MHQAVQAELAHRQVNQTLDGWRVGVAVLCQVIQHLAGQGRLAHARSPHYADETGCLPADVIGQGRHFRHSIAEQVADGLGRRVDHPLSLFSFFFFFFFFSDERLHAGLYQRWRLPLLFDVFVKLGGLLFRGYGQFLFQNPRAFLVLAQGGGALAGPGI